MIWTSNVESCFDLYDAGQRTSLTSYIGKLEDMAMRTADRLTAFTPAMKYERRRVQGLVLCHMHHRDAVSEIVRKQEEEGCLDRDRRQCFAWQKQLRHVS